MDVGSSHIQYPAQSKGSLAIRFRNYTRLTQVASMGLFGFDFIVELGLIYGPNKNPKVKF